MMPTNPPKTLVDEAGKTNVLLSLEEYEALLEELEDARDARIIAERRLDRSDTISLEAFAEELKRKVRRFS